MEELKNEQTEQHAHTAAAEENKGEESGNVSLGKFKDVNALLSAYNSLQSEFTKRCQRVKELEAELNSAVDKATVPTQTEQAESKNKKSFVSAILSRLKPLVNPMFICVIIGAIVGLSGIALPKFIGQSISSMGACMSPLAMILIGCISTRIDFKKLFTKWKIYAISVIRIIAIPLVFIGIFAILPQNSWLTPTFLKCAIVSLAMPMGVSGVFIPAGYGEDTTPIAEMVLVSHLLSVITIPVMFMLFQAVVV